MADSIKHRLRKELTAEVEHKGVKIELDASITSRPRYFVGGRYGCDTLADAIKKANYLATKNAKLKDPIKCLRLKPNKMQLIDIIEKHHDGRLVLKDYETGIKERNRF